MKLRKLAKLIGLGLTIVFCSVSSVYAAINNISHAYQSKQSIPTGSLVSAATQTNYVELADTSNGGKLVGVAVISDDSLVAVDADNGKVHVAVNGTAKTLVSTLNGDIKSGDQIAVSPFGGIGMKANPGDHILGLTQSSLNSQTKGVIDKQVKQKDGQTKQIKVGYASLTIAVGADSAPSGGEKINPLQKIAKSLTGKTISTARIIISIIIAVVALALLGTLLHAAIYGSMVSIGRNPLARHAVFRTLGYATVMALATAATATAAIFFLLN